MSPDVAWQTIAANALEAQAACLETALVELENVHRILAAHGRDDACREVRAVAARLREERNTINDEARQRRAEIPQNGPKPARKGRS